MFLSVRRKNTGSRRRRTRKKKQMGLRQAEERILLAGEGEPGRRIRRDLDKQKKED